MTGCLELRCNCPHSENRLDLSATDLSDLRCENGAFLILYDFSREICEDFHVFGDFEGRMATKEIDEFLSGPLVTWVRSFFVF